MRLLVMAVPREARDEAEAALHAAGAVGFTEIPTVYGEGSHRPSLRIAQRAGRLGPDLRGRGGRRLGPLRKALSEAGMRFGPKLRAFLVPAGKALKTAG